MKQSTWHIIENSELVSRVWRMRLQGDTEGIEPGQFVEISIPGQYLRRPISVCDAENGLLTIIYKVVGCGTDKMSRMSVGDNLDVLTQLGHGYVYDALTLATDDAEGQYSEPLLIGGGVGVPPLYYLAKRLGGKCKVILGFNTKSEVFYEEEFRALGCEVEVTTADGSYGTKGFVTDSEIAREEVLSGDVHYYCCGPLPMIKAVLNTCGKNGQVSMEERMGCGFGICVGCTIQTTDGFRRVCKDGPVFPAEILLL